LMAIVSMDGGAGNCSRGATGNSIDALMESFHGIAGVSFQASLRRAAESPILTAPSPP